jgi:ribokinase
VDEAPRRCDVVVIGTLNVDLTVRVDRLPRPGETITGEAPTTGPGGKAANQAVASARLGAQTALIGCVGDDERGAELMACLSAEPNLRVDGVQRVAGPTGTALVTVDAAGNNTIVSARGANAALGEAHVHRHGREIAEAAVLAVQLGVAHDAIGEALQIARSVGTLTMLDPSPASEVTDELLRLVDICTPNETEAWALTGIDVDGEGGPRRAADALLARGCVAAVITLGARGAFYLSARHGAEGVVIPPMPVTVVDPTAAGDAFNGALAAALARRAPLEQALHTAAVAGALATTRSGALAALPTAAEIDACAGG